MEQQNVNSALQQAECVINSGERLTIETIANFIGQIQAGLVEAATVVIEFNPEVEMDITALQVFCSACKTATTEGKRCIHRGTPPQALLDLLTAAGAERHESCTNKNDFCFRQFEGV
jgi:anti-anti-sigma regulatory factor